MDAAARDPLDDLDPYAEELGEVSCIAKRGGRLGGHAKDPLSLGLAMRALLGEGYFARSGGELLHPDLTPSLFERLARAATARRR